MEPTISAETSSECHDCPSSIRGLSFREGNPTGQSTTPESKDESPPSSNPSTASQPGGDTTQLRKSSLKQGHVQPEGSSPPGCPYEKPPQRVHFLEAEPDQRNTRTIAEVFLSPPRSTTNFKKAPEANTGRCIDSTSGRRPEMWFTIAHAGDDIIEDG